MWQMMVSNSLLSDDSYKCLKSNISECAIWGFTVNNMNEQLFIQWQTRLNSMGYWPISNLTTNDLNKTQSNCRPIRMTKTSFRSSCVQYNSKRARRRELARSKWDRITGPSPLPWLQARSEIHKSREKKKTLLGTFAHETSNEREYRQKEMSFLFSSYAANFPVARFVRSGSYLHMPRGEG